MFLISGAGIIYILLTRGPGVLGLGIGNVGLYTPTDDVERSAESLAPIIEYIAEGKHSLETEEEYNYRKNTPSFLNSTENGPRVVEFYASWCGVS